MKIEVKSEKDLIINFIRRRAKKDKEMANEFLKLAKEHNDTNYTLYDEFSFASATLNLIADLIERGIHENHTE